MSNQKTNKNHLKYRFPPIIIGTMRLGNWGANLSTQEREKFIDACIDRGLTHFDHADIYGHYTEENLFGKVIRRRPDLKSKIQITTKCGIKLVTPNRPTHAIKSYDTSKNHIIQSAENSLKELGLDVLDILLIHRPDYLMNPHKIAEAVEHLKKEGKIIHFGVSNFSTSQFDLLNSYTPLITNQVEISLLHLYAFENGTLDQCIKNGIRPTAWSPFGGGLLFGQSKEEKIINIQKELQLLSNQYNASIDQLLLAWLYKHPSRIIPILGSTKIERIDSALKSLDIQISREDWYKLWQAAKGHEVA